MSPKENEILQEQVEEMLKQGNVRENMSRYAMLALLPKKDDCWSIATISCVINKVTIEYKFSIPHLDNMLDVLN